MFARLNLDDYGAERFDPAKINFKHGSKPDPLDARNVWIWLGSDEELHFNLLRRRAEQLRKYNYLVQAALQEAIRARLSTWYANSFTDEQKYKWRQSVFAVVENDGRSYGYTVQAGVCNPVWAPPDKPILFT